MSDVRVSVVIPAYNAADFIVEALDSIVAQTVLPIEVVIINDGSHDGTGEISKQWALGRQLGFELIVVDQENKGLPASRNVGIGKSSGNWIALLDADDVWEANHLEELILSLASVPGAVASYGAGRLLVDGQLGQTLYDDFWDNPSKKTGVSIAETPHFRISQEILPRLIQGNFIKPSSLMFSVDAIALSGNFNANLRTSEDREFLIRLLLQGDFAYTALPITQYRWHADNISQAKNARRNAENVLRALKVIAEILSSVGHEAGLIACRQQQVRSIEEYLYISSQNGLNDYRQGLGFIFKELKLPSAWRVVRIRDLIRGLFSSIARA